jgi:hypothetical protein
MKPALASIITSVAIIAAAGMVFAASFLALQKVDAYLQLKQAEVRNQAIDGCAQASKYQFTEVVDNTTRVFEEPNQGQYQQCLELKNIQK